MKKITLILTFFALTACQNFVDDQSGIESKIESFVNNKFNAADSLKAITFSRFEKGKHGKQIYYWLDYTFSINPNNQKKILKYHIETDSLLNILTCKDITKL